MPFYRACLNYHSGYDAKDRVTERERETLEAKSSAGAKINYPGSEEGEAGMKAHLLVG